MIKPTGRHVVSGPKPTIPYFFDFEFHDNGRMIEPISLGIVPLHGRQEQYIEFDFDERRVCRENPWVAQNVLPLLTWRPQDRLSMDMAQLAILDMVTPPAFGHDVEFWAYNGSYDWVVMCQIFGSMTNLPKHFPHHVMDLKQAYIQRGRPNGVKPPKAATAHNALQDVRWNRRFYNGLVRTGMAPSLSGPTSQE